MAAYSTLALTYILPNSVAALDATISNVSPSLWSTNTKFTSWPAKVFVPRKATIGSVIGVVEEGEGGCAGVVLVVLDGCSSQCPTQSEKRRELAICETRKLGRIEVTDDREREERETKSCRKRFFRPFALPVACLSPQLLPGGGRRKRRITTDQPSITTTDDTVTNDPHALPQLPHQPPLFPRLDK